MSVSTSLFLRSMKSGFKAHATLAKLVVSLAIFTRHIKSAKDDFKTFSKYTRLSELLPLVHNDSVAQTVQDYGIVGHPNISFYFFEKRILLGLKKTWNLKEAKKPNMVVINAWGGGNVKALAMVSFLLPCGTNLA